MFYANNKAVIRVTRQQLEWCCSTAWPSWYMKDVFMYSQDTNVAVCLSLLTHMKSLSR